MSARGKKSSGEMKVEDIAGGCFTPEKRRLDMTEDGHSAPKERQSVIDEAMESSSMKLLECLHFSPTSKTISGLLSFRRHFLKVSFIYIFIIITNNSFSDSDK